MAQDTIFIAKNGIQANGYFVANSSGIYLANTTLTMNLTSYIGTANNTSFVGAVSAVNVVSNAQLVANLANYTNTAGLVGALSATFAPINNPVFTGLVTVPGLTGVAIGTGTVNTQITNSQVTVQGNTTNFSVLTDQYLALQTNTTVSTILYANGQFSGVANNATNFGGQPTTYYTNATNITTGTVAYARLGPNVVNTTASFILGGNFLFNGPLTVNSMLLSVVNSIANTTFLPGVIAVQTSNTSTSPVIQMMDNTQSLNNKIWDNYLANQIMSFRIINDAYNTSNNWLTVTRSGMNVASISMPTLTVPALASKNNAITIGTYQNIGGGSYVWDSAPVRMSANLTLDDITTYGESNEFLMTLISSQAKVRTLVASTNATTAIGNNVLHFAVAPAVEAGMVVNNRTHPTSLPLLHVVSSNSTAIVLDGNVASPGVSSGDVIATGHDWFKGPLFLNAITYNSLEAFIGRASNGLTVYSEIANGVSNAYAEGVVVMAQHIGTGTGSLLSGEFDITPGANAIATGGHGGGESSVPVHLGLWIANFSSITKGDWMLDTPPAGEGAGWMNGISLRNIAAPGANSGSALNIPLGTTIDSRNAAGNGDIHMLYTDGSNYVHVGEGAGIGGVVFANSAFSVNTSSITSYVPLNLLNGAGLTTTGSVTIVDNVPSWTDSGFHVGSLVTLNGYPTTSMWGAATAGLIQAFVAGITVPSSATGASAHMGISGYGRTQSTTVGAVGGYFQGNLGANGSAAWGGNSLVTNQDSGTYPGSNTGHSGSIWGWEIDVNVQANSSGGSPACNVLGLSVIGASAVGPDASHQSSGVQVAHLGTNVPWRIAFETLNGAANTGLSLGAISAANNSGSQYLILNAVNSSGTAQQSKIYTDSTGNILIEPQSNGVVQTSGPINSTGYRSRAGSLGSYSANYFNVNWTGSEADLWIDSTNQGRIVTPTYLNTHLGYDINTYGADRTGVSYSDTAFASALAALPAGGGTILFPAGTYLFHGALAITNMNIRLLGEGSGITILKFDNATANAAGIIINQSGFQYVEDVIGMSIFTTVDQIHGNAGLYVNYHVANPGISTTLTAIDLDISSGSSNPNFWAYGVYCVSATLAYLQNINARGKNPGNLPTGIPVYPSNMFAGIVSAQYSTAMQIIGGNCCFANYGFYAMGDAEGQLLFGFQAIGVNVGALWDDGVSSGDPTSGPQFPAGYVVDCNFASYLKGVWLKGWCQTIVNNTTFYKRPESNNAYIAVHFDDGHYGAGFSGCVQNQVNGGQLIGFTGTAGNTSTGVTFSSLSSDNKVSGMFFGVTTYAFDFSNTGLYNQCFYCSHDSSLGLWSTGTNNAIAAVHDNKPVHTHDNVTSVWPFPDGTTPTIGGINAKVFYTNYHGGLGGVIVTDIVGGFDEVEIDIFGNDGGLTTIKNNTNIILKGGTDLVLANTQLITLRYENYPGGHLWREKSRNF